ncbi:MAG TPA: hypothetical protein VJB90_02280 [Candidatus Nanoarchaeia archaeon]|nr:hypothetical protein [Candidatus Nanoarchaeia archaeon]
MGRKTTKKDTQIPTVSVLLPELKDHIYDLRKRIEKAYHDLFEEEGADPDLSRLIQALTGVISKEDMTTWQQLEHQQSHVRLKTINGHPMLYQPGPRRQRAPDTLENILLNETAQYFRCVEDGLQNFFCMEETPELNWRYVHVSSSVSIEGIRRLMARNKVANYEEISGQLHEAVTGIKMAGNTNEVIEDMPNIVIRDRDVMRYRWKFSVKTMTQMGETTNDATRHGFETDLSDYRDKHADSLKKKGVRGFNPVLELHARLKTAGDVVFKGTALHPGQSWSHSYGQKVAELMAGKRESVYDLYAGRTVADFRLFQPVMGCYMHDINPDADAWRGRVIAHDFQDRDKAREYIIGHSRPKSDEWKFLNIVAQNIVFEKSRSQKAEREYIPPHIEVLVPLYCTTEDGTEIEMVVARQWWSPSGFDASQKRTGVSHTDYKAIRYREMLREMDKKTLAVYALVCGLVEGYPGLLEPNLVPLAEQIYIQGQNRLLEAKR